MERGTQAAAVIVAARETAVAAVAAEGEVAADEVLKPFVGEVGRKLDGKSC